MRSFYVLSNVILLLIGIVSGCGAGEDSPKGAEDISYWTPAWYDNEHIIYTKMVETVKFHHGLLSEITNMTSELAQRDNFICVTDLEGKGERVLKQFRVKEPRPWEESRKYFIVEGDKEIPIDLEGNLVPADYDCSKEWVVFKLCTGLNTDACGRIYIMKPDGSQMRKLVDEPGCNPRISPDNKKVLYHIAFPYGKGTLCLVNTDGTEKKKLLEDAISGVWSPDGEKIAYFCQSAEKEYFEARHYSNKSKEELEKMRKDVWIYNIKTGEKKEFDRGGHPRDWTPDGKRIFTGGFINILTGEGEFFNIQTNQWEESKKYEVYTTPPVRQDKLVKYLVKDYPWTLPENEKAIRVGLNNKRLSPDCKRFVGDPGYANIGAGKYSEYEGSLGIQELGNSKEITVLRINYVKTIK